MRLLLIEVTTITIIIKLQCCTAQLFPWSNLKQYFDLKTKHGPGNDGVLNINSDFNEGGGNVISFSADRPYRNTDSGTSFSNENENSNPISEYSERPDTTTSKDITKQVLKSYKKNNHKVNLNFDNYPIQDQPYYNSKKETGTNDRTYKTIVPISQDSTVRPNYNIPNNQNVNVQISDNPANVYAENDNYESQNQDTIVITQKPIVIHQQADEKSQNSRISHKTVSIIPSVNMKTQSLIENDNPPIYVTSRPFNYPVTKSQRIKIKELSGTHRPVKQTTLSVFRPRPEYHSLQNDNNPIFLPTVPPSVTVSPKIAAQQPSQLLNTQYSNIQPFNGQKSKLYVETVPSLAITIKASGNKPFRITDGNSGLVDYLIPPPLPSVQSTKSKTLRSPIHVTKQKRKPHQSLKEPSLLTDNSNSYLNTEDEIKIIDEMSKLKPPEKTVQKNTSSNKKLINDKKLQNYLNLLQQQEQQHQLEQQKQYDDSALVYESVKNVRQQRLPRKKSERNAVRNQKRSKYHNHRMTSDEQQHRNNDDNDYKYKDDRNDNQNTAAASQVNEQITSSETGYSEPHSNGDRVEFQMHGQNGPKSYKFGFDTGKGHNRQFRYEERDKDGYVKGHYGYYDKEGKLQLVNYEADPHTGFKADPVPV